MLLAALGASGARSAGDVIDRVSQTCGTPKVTLRQANGAVAAWHSAAGVLARDGWAAEGWLDLGEADVSPRSLPQARGDFALFALHAGGVLLASGRAGGYRPIYVVSPSRELVIACTRLSPLLSFLPRRPPLDLEYLSACLDYGPRPPESTAYVGVRRVPHGEAWLVRPGIQHRR